jgi:hypothetical protein
MMIFIARIELRVDEDTGRRYWWGFEEGWKDATEVGQNGVLMLDVQHFDVGTVLTVEREVNRSRSDDDATA